MYLTMNLANGHLMFASSYQQSPWRSKYWVYWDWYYINYLFTNFSPFTNSPM